MTATNTVQDELRRFLKSRDAEVLCLTGDWGVGKTFTWQAALSEVKKNGTHALDRYSYVSLFGIDSLDSLKLALFENLEFLDAPAESLVQQGLRSAKSLFAHAKKLSSVASALPYIGGPLSKAGPLYFGLIRDQIICIDDIERRGSRLDLKDVFGLVSYLREQRRCKVILLLNADALENSKADFDTYFEKVIDARLIFAPTALEACNIALPNDDLTSQLLRDHCEKLGISNIRVIKKIERLFRQVEPYFKDLIPETFIRAAHSVTLFGWSKFQPKSAPPIDFYRTSSTERYFTKRESKQKLSSKEQEWETLLSKYQFSHMDEFDQEVLKFVDSGVLDSKSFAAQAADLEQQIARQKKAGSYEKAWRPFHDSFDDNLDEVVRSVVDGLKNSHSVISLSNLSDSIEILKRLGKKIEATEILQYFIEQNDEPGFWDTSHDLFNRSRTFDPDVTAAIDAHQQKNAAPFEPEKELLKAAQSYNSETIKKLAEISVDDFYKMIKARKGEEQQQLIYAALEFRRISNATPEMLELVSRMESALKKIGSETSLNALRLEKYGIAVQ
jgi:hypothetical protein